MKRRLSRCLTIVLLAAIALFFPLLASPHRIDEAHRNMIRDGMTIAEVENIFGVPAGTYDWAVVESEARNHYYEVLMAHMETQYRELARNNQKIPLAVAVETPRRRIAFGDRIQSWTSRHGSVIIGFDESGLVSWVSGWHRVRVEPPWNKWWKKLFGK